MCQCVLCSNHFDMCPSRKLECHEVWVYDDKNHIQTLMHCITLCTECHKIKHLNQWWNKLTKDYNLELLEFYGLTNGYIKVTGDNIIDDNGTFVCKGDYFHMEIIADIDKVYTDLKNACELQKQRNNYKWVTDFGIYARYFDCYNILAYTKRLLACIQ